MIKNKIFLIPVICILFSNFVVAQNGTISGTVIDSQNQATIEYVSVSILNPLDSAVITGVLSKKNGSFSIPNINSGKYTIQFYFLGYETFLLENSIVEGNTQIQLGTIKLKRTAQSLEEVVVLGKKSNSYNKIDKQQYKANQFQTSKGVKLLRAFHKYSKPIN